ncbi:hypothetical protein [Lacinutrix undariae]
MKKTKQYIILGVLFFLPVTFLLFLIPADHNYTPLEIINSNVDEIIYTSTDASKDIQLKDHITVLGFLGNTPMDNAVATLNLKELVYDKFKGFKTFQIVLVAPNGTQESVKALKSEINTYEELKFWHYVFASPSEILSLYNSLDASNSLNLSTGSKSVFIIDKELNQRGRVDDRETKEKDAEKPVYGLTDYNCIEVAVIKNKMNDDLRVLFTEYREKREGKFKSSQKRREQEIKTQSNE